MLDLSKLPDLPALQQLARALWHNGSIRGAALMVGAGFSKNAILQASDTREPPNWSELIVELTEQLYPTDRSAAPTDALRIAEEYRTYFGQAALDGFIRTRFPDRAWLPGPLHLQALNFPWSDILTTNWDTLLERTAEDMTDFIYEVVRTEADLAHARAQRIVKLHGTLGDKDPLIFAAEDYRTYPIRHAAFVNLARQIFIENDLCLLGFSGNDPNFLEWAGWVRDQLGGNARRIYLIGYLNLSVSARRYLEAHNIAPIDFAPLVQHLASSSERHRTATQFFFEALRLDQPPPLHEWKRHEHSTFPLSKVGIDGYERARKDPKFAAAALDETAKLLEDDRESYPGWLVCPLEYRRPIQYGNDEAWLLKEHILCQFGPNRRAEILNEFLWRYTIGFRELGEPLQKALVAIMEDPLSRVKQTLRLRFALALMRHSRLKGDDLDLEKWGAVVDAEAVPEALERTEAQYQRCLRLRDRFDVASLAAALSKLTDDSPIWKLRRAALHTEVGEYIKATKLIRDSSADLEKSYRLDRNSLWVKSCLGWANWLSRACEFANFTRRNDLPRRRDFKDLKIDPEGEIEGIQSRSDELRSKRQEDDAEVIPLFDAGSYRNGSARTRVSAGDQGLELLFEFDQIMETVGLPLRINHVGITSSAALSVVRVSHHHSLEWYAWFLRALHSHLDNPFNRYFGRVAIAQLSDELSRDLRSALDAGISFWVVRFKQASAIDQRDDRSVAVDQLRLCLHAQSHMSVRMTEHEAVTAFARALEVGADPVINQRWLIEAAGELAKYAAQSISVERQGALALAAMEFPLSSERGGHAQLWPDITQTIWEATPDRVVTNPRWDHRVQQLLDAAAPDATAREEAIARLSYLSFREVLKDSEKAEFAQILWAQVDADPYPLPVNTACLMSAFAQLPAPQGIDANVRVSARIFGLNLTQVMKPDRPIDTAMLAKKQNELISLYNTAPIGLSMPSDRANELFDQIVSWNPSSNSDSDPFGEGFIRNFDAGVRVKASDILTFAVVPAMTGHGLTEARASALLDFIVRTQAWRGLGALPHFIASVPALADGITSAVRRGLFGSEYVQISGAATALIQWAKLVRTGTLSDFPRSLVEQLLATIETRHEEGLHILIHAAVSLVKNNIMIETDLLRLERALADLLASTKYDDVLLDSRRAVSISLVRQESVRLASILKQWIPDSGTLNVWLAEGASDPLPEVRFATHAV